MNIIRIDQQDSVHSRLRIDGLYDRFSMPGIFRSSKNRISLPQLDVILRAVRVLIGSLILVTIATAILIPQVLPVSGNSYVNAKLEWIRTPIEGDVAFGDLRVGDKISQGTVLGTITNERADDFFLNQLHSEQSNLESTLFTLENRKKHLTSRKRELQERVSKSLSDLEEKSESRLAIVKNEIAMATDELSSVIERMARYKRANADFANTNVASTEYAVVSRAAMEALADREMALQTSIASLESSMGLLESNLEAALTGTFASQDTPIEQQQLIDIEHSIKSIDSEIESLHLKSDKLAAQVDARVELLQSNTHYQMVAGISGTLWDIGFPDGSYVSHGDSVVAIADTKTIVVEGNFHQRYLDNVKVGDPATVDLMGSKRRLEGTVSEVRIRDQIKSADLSAFNFESPATNEFKVVVELANTEQQDIHIGQRAKLIISKSSSSIVPSVLLFFNR